MSSGAAQRAVKPACVSSTKGAAVPLPKKDKQSSRPLPTAFHGQDSIAYGAALARGRGPEGVHAPHVPEQRPSHANQPCHNSPRTDSTPFSNGLTFNFELPASFEYARQAAEHLTLPASQCPCGVSSTPVEPVEQVEGPTQEELHDLSLWLRLRDQTLPPPIVGGIESDLSGVADRYGVKGMSVFTTFVNAEDLSCRVCSFTASTLQLALVHQEETLHF